MRVYNAESPKQGSRRVSYIVKTKYIADLSIVYLCLIGLVFVQITFPLCVQKCPTALTINDNNK